MPDGQGVPHALAGAGLDELGVAASAAAAERGDSLGDLVRSRLPHAQATLATQRAGVQLSLEAPFWGRGTGPVSMLYCAGDAEGYRVVPLLRSPNAQPRTPPRPCGFSTSRRPRNLRRVPQVSDAHEDGATEAAAQLASGAPRPPDPGAGDGASAAHDGPPADKAREPTPAARQPAVRAPQVSTHCGDGATEATAQLASGAPRPPDPGAPRPPDPGAPRPPDPGAPRPPDPGAGDGASAAHDGPPADKAPEPDASASKPAARVPQVSTHWGDTTGCS